MLAQNATNPARLQGGPDDSPSFSLYTNFWMYLAFVVYVAQHYDQIWEWLENKTNIMDTSSNRYPHYKYLSSLHTVRLQASLSAELYHAIDRFRILAIGRSQCHLNVLEAVSIKSLSPSMCLQKEHVKKLMLFRSMVCVICSVVNFTAMYMYIAHFYVLNVILHCIGYSKILVLVHAMLAVVNTSPHNQM